MAGTNRRFRLETVYNTALNWLFPPQCAGCKRLGEVWCTSCNQAVARIDSPCLTCGFPLEEDTKDCPGCKSAGFAFQQARSWGFYERELRLAILALKNRENPILAASLASGLKGVFSQQEWDPDFVVPIPLAATRQAERGFNQAELLASAFAGIVGLPVLLGALQRTRHTLSQVGLNPRDRRENLQDAFRAETNLVNKKNFLLLDDVLTTGATMDSAAHALKQAGANRVYALTLARAIW